MLGSLITSKTRLRMLVKFFVSAANNGYLNGLANELTEAEADWQIHAYGSTSHAFTNKEANSPEMGMAYNFDADRRSWKSMTDFLKEAIG